MVRIIRLGTLPEEKLFQCTCNYCKTVFEFKAKEAKKISNQREGPYYQIACPVCNTMCFINSTT